MKNYKKYTLSYEIEIGFTNSLKSRIIVCCKIILDAFSTCWSVLLLQKTNND